jgi:hypothetical protein
MGIRYLSATAWVLFGFSALFLLSGGVFAIQNLLHHDRESFPLPMVFIFMGLAFTAMGSLAGTIWRILQAYEGRSEQLEQRLASRPCSGMKK